MRSSFTLRMMLVGGLSSLLWCLLRDCFDAIAFTGAASESLQPQSRWQSSATQRRQAPFQDSVFQTVNGAMATQSNHFEKVSENGVLTAVSKDGYSSGSHVWRIQRLAGIGLRTRIGVCIGNVSWETNPMEEANDNSFWFYEETSGSLNVRTASNAATRVANAAGSKIPYTMYTGDELALILDCEQRKLYFYWPSGEEGLIEDLPSGALQFFISVQDKGDSWQVTKEAMPEPEKVYKDNSWVMEQYRKLPGF